MSVIGELSALAKRAEEPVTQVTVDGQVAIITGAGNGLGRIYALELARRGAAVVVNDIAVDAANAVVKEIEATGGRAAASYDSIATPESARAILQTSLDRFGTLDILIHNAGTWRNVPIEEMTPDNLDPVIDVHLRGAFFLVRPAWRIFREKGYGRIVLTSSAAGAFGREEGSNYVAVKAGLFGLARGLALEGAKHGILVNSLLPNAETSRRPMNPEYRARLNAVLEPLDGRRTPEAVAPLVVYLASRQCSVTGEAFSAGAGRFARVFVGVTEGWTSAPIEPASPEDVLDHLGEIEDRSRYIVPISLFDETEAIAASVRASTTPSRIGVPKHK